MSKINADAILKIFLTNLAIQVCNVVTGVLTARILLPMGRGELATVILWPSVLAGLGLLGSNWALTREAAVRPDKEADMARTAVVLSLALAGLGMVLGYFLVPHLLPADKKQLTGLTRLYLLFLPLNFLALNLIGLEQGRMRWRRFNLVRLSVTLPYLFLLLGFWVLGVDRVTWFILALLVSNLFPVMLCLILQRQKILQGRAHLKDTLYLLRQGFPFFLAAVGGVIASQVDKALVVSLLSMEAVGWYACAFTFAAAHGSLGEALGTTTFTALANEPDPGRQGQYLSKVFRQSSLLYLGAGSGVALLAPLAIVPLFGREFAPAVKPAAVLALVTSLAALSSVLNEGLRGLGKTSPGIKAQFLGGGVVALGAWLLVPSYGLMGMAGAAVLGVLGQLLVLLAVAMALLRLSPSQLWGFRLEEVKSLWGRLREVVPLGGWLTKVKK